MGFWAGIKYALNSTIGTEDFISLDKLIKGQRTLAASDSTIAIIESSNSGISYDIVFKKSFIPKTDGVVRVIVDIAANTSSSYFTIYENGIAITQERFYTGDNRELVHIDIPVVKNFVYTFRPMNSVVWSVAIGAQIVDGSLFEVKETT